MALMLQGLRLAEDKKGFVLSPDFSVSQLTDPDTVSASAFMFQKLELTNKYSISKHVGIT